MKNWWWLMIALIAALGCGNRTRTVGGTGTSSGRTAGGGEPAGDQQRDAAPSGPVLRRVMHLTIELQVVDPEADPVQTAVDVVMTDETGANDRAEVGEFTGTCTDTSADHRTDPMTPILSVDCVGGDPGVALRFVHRNNELIVLRAKVYEGEELSFDEHTRIALPEAVPVKTDHD